MEAHYNNIIGLVPLTKMNHELAHNGDIFLSKKQIFGDYAVFMKKYENAISVDILRKIQKNGRTYQKRIPF